MTDCVTNAHILLVELFKIKYLYKKDFSKKIQIKAPAKTTFFLMPSF